MTRKKNTPPKKNTKSDNKQRGIIDHKLASTVISLPLLDEIEKSGTRLKPLEIIIDVNLNYPGGRDKARERIWKLIRKILEDKGKSKNLIKQGVNATKSIMSKQYIFALLDADVIQDLVRLDRSENICAPNIPTAPDAIWCIWPDFEITAQITQSISTVKADAAQRSFASFGDGITWAVLDSGIDETVGVDHNLFPHLNLMGLLEKLDQKSALVDVRGHGTHVAGIIAGEIRGKVKAQVTSLDEAGKPQPGSMDFDSISGMAPRCKLVSLKVLDDKGKGPVSNVVAALAAIQEINGYGRWLRIHGVNLSIGYDFNPEWFACGQSPLCVEVDRLVKSGVVIVAAAGNTGFGTAFSASRKTDSAGLGITINDPGNAELAITVGATHRNMPHVYGVSYFSSKGPTGDGRNKPDLVAPGEKIISCASLKTAGQPAGPATAGSSSSSPAAAIGQATPVVADSPANVPTALSGDSTITNVSAAASPAMAPAATESTTKTDLVTDRYVEMSGTSMAAPHVSGVIAAFLSVRREFVDRPEHVKEIFISTATDLKRNNYFQGHGLIDQMRAIQSV